MSRLKCLDLQIYRASSPLTELLASTRSKQDDVEAARKLFAAASKKRLDYPEYLFDAWVTLEHRDGTLDTLETALTTVRREMKYVNARRQRVSWNIVWPVFSTPIYSEQS